MCVWFGGHHRKRDPENRRHELLFVSIAVGASRAIRVPLLWRRVDWYEGGVDTLAEIAQGQLRLWDNLFAAIVLLLEVLKLRKY